MTFKKTIGSLSFVLAATVSSIALAQGLGVAPDAQVGAGNAPVAASPQAGGQTSVDANVGAQAGANPNSSTNSPATDSDSKGAASAAGSSLSGATQATESSGKKATGTGLDTAAVAKAHDTPIKTTKAKKTQHAKKSTKAKVDLDAGTQPNAQNPN